jgi:hypothetical protein
METTSKLWDLKYEVESLEKVIFLYYQDAHKDQEYSIKYHYLRELVQDKEVRLEYVNTKELLANFIFLLKLRDI